MRALRRPFQVIRADLRPYLVMNVVVYGLALLGMALGMLFPDLYAARSAPVQAEDGWTSSLVMAVIDNVWTFAGTILLVNVFATALLLIVLPSLVVPFAGLVVFGLKTLDLGIVLAPVDATATKILLPHSLTLLIEFQAYVLVMLGAYLLGRSWLRPSTVGASTRRQGYVGGLSRLGWLWVPAFVLFVVGAIYEAFEVLYLVPPLLAP
ncbi:stage II sporulation protein M [Pseudonocardia sp. KRD291]|uniref:stage II sporulation protein M n=1 Tax=Pseudonocardia sp. KRD291 TaxID=2792007 RepID=UPI001C4A3608|nr:stage II sporulation protein M [Pseudonocardia sp. KRD291]MBW0102182.1 stage II sporulation protein M [Pseudonocardia sp. KRD291]